MTSAVVASLVACPRITSTSCITGTGFMKCIPITWSGRRVAAAISVIEMELVLVARIASGTADPIELLEQGELDRGTFAGGLDHELADAAASTSGPDEMRPSTWPTASGAAFPSLPDAPDWPGWYPERARARSGRRR